MGTVTTADDVRPRTRWETIYAPRLLTTDVVVIAGAVFLAQFIRFGGPLHEGGAAKSLTAFSVLFALLWMFALAMFRTRSPRVIGGGIDEHRQVVSASFWTFGVIAIVALLLKLEITRGYLAVAFPLGTLGLLLGRHFWNRQLARERAQGRCQTSVLAIGDKQAVSVLARELMRKPANGYRIVGVGVPGYGAPKGEAIVVNGDAIPILGNEVAALDAIEEYGADTVAITGTEHFGVDGIRRLVWQLEAMDVDLVVSPGVIDIAGQRLTMRPVSGYPLIHVEKPQYEGANRFQKRTFDFFFALAALVATAPILVCAAIAIKLSSRGPVFYVADRLGLDRKPFRMLKLRTMVEDADAQLYMLAVGHESPGAVLFKMRDDPRITPVGRVLRRYSIDELPQFINVLKNDMSVVGPRPWLPLQRPLQQQDVETYARRRLLVKPGVTGAWQVSGRSDLSWEDSVRIDLSYVENWSMAGDLVIILKTIKAVFSRQGAY
ncbi:sugar transferase [Mycobacterium malmoense]|uniref:sugar transferase n=1 Tax=Mycobacterium malmoense TaxID=1780 RepID=UPI0008F7FCFF|nr:sugar transferase [Mycobacterium malmoense]OIN80658.1 polyprenyl glycosylphosphotransferase [Mycobacterium malmoense]